MSAEKNICVQMARKHYYSVMNRIVELKAEVNKFIESKPLVEGIRKTEGINSNLVVYVLECERKALSLLRTIERRAKSEPYHLCEEFKKLEDEVRSTTPQKLEKMQLAVESPAAMAFFIGFSKEQVNKINQILGEYLDFETQLKIVEWEQNSLDKFYWIYYEMDGKRYTVGSMEAKQTFIGEETARKMKISPYEGAAQIKYDPGEDGYYVVVGRYSFTLDEEVLRVPVYISSNMDGFFQREIGMNFAAFRSDLRWPEFKVEVLEVKSTKPNAEQPEINLLFTALLEEGRYVLRNGSVLDAYPSKNKMLLVVSMDGKFADIITSEDENKNIRGINRYY